MYVLLAPTPAPALFRQCGAASRAAVWWQQPAWWWYPKWDWVGPWPSRDHPPGLWSIHVICGTQSRARERWGQQGTARVGKWPFLVWGDAGWEEGGVDRSAVFLEWRRAESTKSSTNSWPERVHSASSNIYHFLIERKVFSVYVKGKAWSKKIISKFTEFLFTSLSKMKILPYDNSIKNTHITTFRRFVMVYLFFYSM